MHISVCYSVC